MVHTQSQFKSISNKKSNIWSSTRMRRRKSLYRSLKKKKKSCSYIMEYVIIYTRTNICNNIFSNTFLNIFLFLLLNLIRNTKSFESHSIKWFIHVWLLVKFNNRDRLCTGKLMNKKVCYSVIDYIRVRNALQFKLHLSLENFPLF